MASIHSDILVIKLETIDTFCYCQRLGLSSPGSDSRLYSLLQKLSPYLWPMPTHRKDHVCRAMAFANEKFSLVMVLLSHCMRSIITVWAATSEISLTTIYIWMCSIILRAYHYSWWLTLVASNPHETWAVASTLTLHSNFTLGAIMEGCFWQSYTVFSSYYRRDVSVTDV